MNIIKKMVFGIDDKDYTLEDLMDELKIIHAENKKYIRSKQQLKNRHVGCFSQQQSTPVIELNFKKNGEILNKALGYLEYERSKIKMEKKQTKDTDLFVELTLEMVEIEVKISLVKDYIELNNNLS